MTSQRAVQALERACRELRQGAQSARRKARSVSPSPDRFSSPFSFFGVTSMTSFPDNASLKPRVALPRPLPISGSRLALKRSITMIRMINNS